MYIMALKNLHNWKAKASRVLQKLDQNEEGTDEESEIEDVSENILLEGEDDIIEESTESDDEADEETEVADVSDEVSTKEPRKVFKGMRSNPGSWDEDESTNEDKEKVGGRLSKDIEGVTWIDEEGLVVKPNVVLEATNRDECDDKIHEVTKI